MGLDWLTTWMYLRRSVGDIIAPAEKAAEFLELSLDAGIYGAVGCLDHAVASLKRLIGLKLPFAAACLDRCPRQVWLKQSDVLGVQADSVLSFLLGLVNGMGDHLYDEFRGDAQFLAHYLAGNGQSQLYQLEFGCLEQPLLLRFGGRAQPNQPESQLAVRLFRRCFSLLQALAPAFGQTLLARPGLQYGCLLFGLAQRSLSLNLGVLEDGLRLGARCGEEFLR
jgi:hypothetical protein